MPSISVNSVLAGQVSSATSAPKACWPSIPFRANFCFQCRFPNRLQIAVSALGKAQPGKFPWPLAQSSAQSLCLRFGCSSLRRQAGEATKIFNDFLLLVGKFSLMVAIFLGCEDCGRLVPSPAKPHAVPCTFLFSIFLTSHPVSFSGLCYSPCSSLGVFLYLLCFILIHLMDVSCIFLLSLSLSLIIGFSHYSRCFLSSSLGEWLLPGDWALSCSLLFPQ